jgi:hypothetical protein
VKALTNVFAVTDLATIAGSIAMIVAVTSRFVVERFSTSFPRLLNAETNVLCTRVLATPLDESAALRAARLR